MSVQSSSAETSGLSFAYSAHALMISLISLSIVLISSSVACFSETNRVLMLLLNLFELAFFAPLREFYTLQGQTSSVLDTGKF